MREAEYVTMIDPFTLKYGKWGALQVRTAFLYWRWTRYPAILIYGIKPITTLSVRIVWYPVSDLSHVGSLLSGRIFDRILNEVSGLKILEDEYVTMIDLFTRKYGKWGALQVRKAFLYGLY